MKSIDLMRRMGFAASAMPEWHTTFDEEPTGYSSGWANYTLRVRIPASALGTCSKVRLTLYPGVSASGFTIEKLFIGKHKVGGTWHEFESAPMQVTSGGSPTIFVAPSGGPITCDATPIALAAGEELVLSAYFSAGSCCDSYGHTGWATAENSGDDSETLSPSNYNYYYTGRVLLVRKIEIFS